MKIFDILQNTVFDGCNVECYSLWIKKRVLVYEYGPQMQGKIKLSLEAEQEEGALIYNSTDCGLSACGYPHFDAMFIYRHKDQREFSVSLVLTREKITKQDIENFIHSLEQCKEKISLPHIRWKAVIATEIQISPEEKSKLLAAFSRVYTGKYSDYIGRNIEAFIKT